MSHQKDENDPNDHWVVPGVSYVNPARIHCRFCGSPIPRRYWRVNIGLHAGLYCNSEHAEMFLTYTVPTWGTETRSMKTDE